jgi:putrescine aminotransferase
MGMFLGIRMAHELLGQVMVKTCYEAGLLCVYAAHDKSVVQFLPPLIADSDLAGVILERLGRAVELAASLAG